MKENLLLGSELELSRQTKAYFIIDLEDRVVSLKIKGVAIRNFPLREVLRWGTPVRIAPLTFVRKSALTPPERPEVKPGEPEAKASGDGVEAEAGKVPAASTRTELEALELKDMPREFTLVFKGEVYVSVEGKPQGFASRISSLWRSLRWHVGSPLRTLVNAARGKPYSSIRLVMDGADAQALYWAFPEGSPAVII